MKFFSKISHQDEISSRNFKTILMKITAFRRQFRSKILNFHHKSLEIEKEANKNLKEKFVFWK